MTKTEIAALLASNDRAVERALIVLAAQQTEDERRSQHTHDLNNRGFNKLDAEIFTSFAQQLQRGRGLSPRQLRVCRKNNRLAKYHRQLNAAAEAKSELKRLEAAISAELVQDADRTCVDCMA